MNRPFFDISDLDLSVKYEFFMTHAHIQDISLT